MFILQVNETITPKTSMRTQLTYLHLRQTHVSHTYAVYLASEYALDVDHVDIVDQRSMRGYKHRNKKSSDVIANANLICFVVNLYLNIAVGQHIVKFIMICWYNLKSFHALGTPYPCAPSEILSSKTIKIFTAQGILSVEIKVTDRKHKYINLFSFCLRNTSLSLNTDHIHYVVHSVIIYKLSNNFTGQQSMIISIKG